MKATVYPESSIIYSPVFNLRDSSYWVFFSTWTLRESDLYHEKCKILQEYEAKTCYNVIGMQKTDSFIFNTAFYFQYGKIFLPFPQSTEMWKTYRRTLYLYYCSMFKKTKQNFTFSFLQQVFKVHSTEGINVWWLHLKNLLSNTFKKTLETMWYPYFTVGKWNSHLSRQNYLHKTGQKLCI